MLLEIIKYASSGIIPFLVTVSILSLICWAVANFSIVKIDTYRSGDSHTHITESEKESLNQEGDK